MKLTTLWASIFGCFQHICSFFWVYELLKQRAFSENKLALSVPLPECPLKGKGIAFIPLSGPVVFAVCPCNSVSPGHLPLFHFIFIFPALSIPLLVSVISMLRVLQPVGSFRCIQLKSAPRAAILGASPHSTSAAPSVGRFVHLPVLWTYSIWNPPPSLHILIVFNESLIYNSWAFFSSASVYHVYGVLTWLCEIHVWSPPSLLVHQTCRLPLPI